MLELLFLLQLSLTKVVAILPNVMRFINFLELIVVKVSAFLFTLLMFGIAHAEDIKDAPVGEPNIAGILIFIGISVGCAVWYTWKIVAKHKKDNAKK